MEAFIKMKIMYVSLVMIKIASLVMSLALFLKMSSFSLDTFDIADLHQSHAFVAEFLKLGLRSWDFEAVLLKLGFWKLRLGSWSFETWFLKLGF